MKTIYLAAGCFWGTQEYFSRVDGVKETVAGYANSIILNPTYEEVCTGETKAAETVEIFYDDKIINLEGILENYFQIIDPTVKNRQGNDIGTQYRTGIYYVDDEDENIIKNYISLIQKNYDSEIVTEVLPLENFFHAEEYHQNYLKKNPDGYCHIKLN